MLPTSVTSRVLNATACVHYKVVNATLRSHNVVVKATTRVHHVVVNATTRVHNVVNNATTRVHNKVLLVALRVHDGVERVHLDAVDRGYRAQYTHEQEILAVVDKSRTVKSLRDQVLALREHVVSLSFVCVVLAVGNFVQLLYFISR